MINFTDATVQQGELLADLLIASKGYWGYSVEQLQHWRKLVDFDSHYIEQNTVKIIYQQTTIIGFFAIKKGETDELDHLWLLPPAIGKGIGNIAFNEIVNECRNQGITSFMITSDPDAEGFYRHKGAIRVSQVMSEAQNRMLPLLRFDVD